MRRLLIPCLLAATTFAFSQATNQNAPIDLSVDATEASRNILHVTLKMQAQAGELALVYPEWIPGEHGPTGPIVDMVGLHIFADGKEISWSRDNVDMYRFNVTVPAGAASIEARYDQLLPSNAAGFSSGASSTANLAMLSWNQVVLYPAGAPSDAVQVTAHLKMPRDWNFGSPLPVATHSGQQLDFKPVTLTMLVDSPVLMGKFFRSIPLGEDMGRPHFFDIAADSSHALDVPDATVAGLKQLVKETGALFGARHYRDYHFLVTLSDSTAHFGLEHHEASDDRSAERTFIDDSRRWRTMSLYSHEMTHSWNGKYRRPAGLATANYQDPMKGDLLWVYEGLTQYIGEILPARAGLWTPEQFREQAAEIAASMDKTSGRTWRPLQDTATAAQLLYGAPREWANWRRSVDYYPEGFLLWLEADTIIRKESHGQRSLDDFCRSFHGGASSDPKIVPYTFDDIVSALNSVQPYDWRAFWTRHLQGKDPHAPLGGIENGGWKLAYTDKQPTLVQDRESGDDVVDVRYSIGLSMDDKGEISDVIRGLSAERAGIAPGMKVIAVNGRAFSRKLLHDAIAASKDVHTPLQLLASNGEFFQTYNLDYHEGEKYPILLRDDGKPDVLGEIIRSKAGK
jgi:predicted metalloprotease with PDZ domain